MRLSVLNTDSLTSMGNSPKPKTAVSQSQPNIQLQQKKDPVIDHQANKLKNEEVCATLARVHTAVNHNHHYDLRNQIVSCQYLNTLVKQINSLQEYTHSISLHLYESNIRDEGCNILAGIQQQRIQTLALAHNTISWEGCAHLANSQWVFLKELNLHSNKVGAKGCKYLTRANWKFLKNLNLSTNQITAKGCQHLSKAEWKQLQFLNLDNNQLGQKGCWYLQKVNFDRMQKLYLNSNSVRESGWRNTTKMEVPSLTQLFIDDNIPINSNPYYRYRYQLYRPVFEIRKTRESIKFMMDKWDKLKFVGQGTKQNIKIYSRISFIQIDQEHFDIVQDQKLKFLIKQI